MSRLIERVAQVICAEGNVEGFRCSCPHRVDGWCNGGRALQQARAAVESLRDLSGNEMIFMRGGNAAPSNGQRRSPTRRIGDMAAKEAWETMIDAILAQR